MSGVSKITTDRNLRILLELAAKPGNDACADCKARNPRWASHNLGIFICMNCASIHRKIGTHVTKVKSVTMDSWTKEQIESMRNNGNTKSNAIYNPNENKYPPPVSTMDGERDSEMEQYIRGKYEHKRFIARPASAAPKIETTTLKRRTTSTGLGVPTVRSSSRTPSPGTRTPAAVPMTQTRSFSQPLPNIQSGTPMSSFPPAPTSRQPVQQQQQQPQQPQPQQQGVWADLVSLQGPSSQSSLPLQYQSPSNQMPMMTGIQTQHSTPFQQQPQLPFQSNQTSFQPNTNPFQQNAFQPAATSFQSAPGSFSTNPFQLNTNAIQSNPGAYQQSTNPFHQQSNGFGQSSYTGYSTNPFSSGQQQPSPFPMQPQFTSQPMVQSPAAQPPMMQNSFLSPTPQMSSPVGMTNFSTPSPQPFPMSTTPQIPPPQFNMTPSPQPNFMPQNNFMQAQQQQQPQQQQFAQWAMPQNTGFNGMPG